MPRVYIFNNYSGVFENYYLNGWESMPYITGRTLTVDEFQGSSRSNLIWTDTRVMESWNNFRRIWGRPIFVGYAFKRIWEGGHAGQSQHYAGTAFDIGQNLDPATRNRLRVAAINSGAWSYVEPAYLTPTWVHIDRRLGPPACPGGGYPRLATGSRGIYVLVLQDALNALGYIGSGLDGYFGPGTRSAVVNFQRAQGLSADGVVGCNTWRRLTSLANGIGLTPTVLNP